MKITAVMFLDLLQGPIQLLPSFIPYSFYLLCKLVQPTFPLPAHSSAPGPIFPTPLICPILGAEAKGGVASFGVTAGSEFQAGAG